MSPPSPSLHRLDPSRYFKGRKGWKMLPGHKGSAPPHRKTPGRAAPPSRLAHPPEGGVDRSRRRPCALQRAPPPPASRRDGPGDAHGRSRSSYAYIVARIDRAWPLSFMACTCDERPTCCCYIAAQAAGMQCLSVCREGEAQRAYFQVT
jgi:hypothetical protein